ncbi:MAG: Nucleoside transporter, ATP-binding protein [Labilithrix sp.]|nr:Nucleoside transporter, ATP-binding protein [Labilithrix sp.]
MDDGHGLSLIIRNIGDDCLILGPVNDHLPLLARATGVAKRYGDCVAVAAATVTFRAGEIHAVCGENGAGKSTLLRMVAGMVVPDEGAVEAFGSALRPHTPREAIRRGIGMVLQHFALVPVFTALENIVLGDEPTTTFGVIDLAAARRRAEAVARELGADLPLDARVESLGVGDRQRLEIARALYRRAKLLILDEPTAVLTKGEAAALYETLRRLAAAGTGVVVVTHKMDEVRAHADVVTVMRRGEVVFTKALDRTTDEALGAQVEEVTSAIMGAGRAEGRPGHAATGTPRGRAASSAEVLLAADDVTAGRLRGVSLAVHAGEIVGVAGVEGNGQSELVALLGGDLAPEHGTVRGARVTVIHEDRQGEGLVLDATARDNLLLGELGAFAGAFGVLRGRELEAEAKARLVASGAPQDLDRTARSLSGGNQQKLVVARALARLGKGGARVLVAAQPTRGVDIGASQDIHDRLRDAAAQGAGVLVLSADLDELRSLCDRILVLSRGRVVADLPPTSSDEHIGRLMLGVTGDEHAA